MKNHRFLWLRNRTTDNRKCEKARNIKEKRTIEMFSTVISLVVVAIYTGLSQGIQPVISRSYGAQNMSEVIAVLKYAMAAMLILSAVIYSVLYFETASIDDIFNNDGNEILRQLAEKGLRLYFAACPL